jgi:Na+-transporting methylmalonyl-CoA/oxaloacetate decarboxylase gamma subunit
MTKHVPVDRNMKKRIKLLLAGFSMLTVLGLGLLVDLAFLYLAIFLICPLTHLFMHDEHDGKHEESHSNMDKGNAGAKSKQKKE